LYVWAWLDDTPGIRANFLASVTAQPVNQVQALITSTKGTPIASPIIRSQLLDLLNTALQDFQEAQAQAGADVIRAYVTTVQSVLGKAMSQDKGSRLIAQAVVILQCVPKASVRPKPIALVPCELSLLLTRRLVRK
jgi:hypothetical protein